MFDLKGKIVLIIGGASGIGASAIRDKDFQAEAIQVDVSV